MTHHAHEHPAPAGDWQATLRSKGYRLTPQRELVLRAVERLGTPPRTRSWAPCARSPQAVNISTVYRTLELLEELGLVRHAHISDRAPTYHSAAAPEHVHLVCRECHAITEVAPAVVEPLVASVRSTYGFVTDVGHLTVFGTCGRCAT